MPCTAILKLKHVKIFFICTSVTNSLSCTVQVAVPAKMAGTIIGPKGQNFRRIEAKTGVMKLKLVPGPNEVCNVDRGYAALHTDMRDVLF